MKNFTTGLAAAMLLGAAVPHLTHAYEDTMTAEERGKKLDRFAADLKLTPDQKTQVHSIKAQKYEKIDAAEKEARDQIRALLTPEQMVKFDKMMEKKVTK